MVIKGRMVKSSAARPVVAEVSCPACITRENNNFRTIRKLLSYRTRSQYFAMGTTNNLGPMPDAPLKRTRGLSLALIKA